jgi:hypothetical protein
MRWPPPVVLPITVARAEPSIMMITSGVVRQVSLHGDHDQLGPGHLGQRERDLQRASGRESPLHGGPTHPEVLTRLRS